VNSKQRVLTALNNGQPDKVPICDWIDRPTILNLAAYLGLDSREAGASGSLLWGQESFESLDLLCLLIEELGIDALWCGYSHGSRRIDETHARNKYGQTFRLNEPFGGVLVDGPIKEPSHVRGYDMASRVELDDLGNVQYLIEQMGPDRLVMMGISDPFSKSWGLRGGMEQYLMDFIEHPGLVHDLARIVTDHGLAVVDLAAQIGVEVMAMAGDLAGNQTTLISPEHFREFVKPYEKELVDYAHRKGMKIIKHSDGNNWPILDDFVEIGFDGFDPVQPQCMDIGEVKEHLAGKISIMGNIDCQHLLPFGTPEEVEATVKETIAIAAPGGGYILASSNSLHAGCKPENIVAMVQAAHRYGVYPLSLD
jgi:uroporphyrinogen decarboxylase